MSYACALQDISFHVAKWAGRIDLRLLFLAVGGTNKRTGINTNAAKLAKIDVYLMLLSHAGICQLAFQCLDYGFC